MNRKRVASAFTVLAVFVLVGTSLWFFVTGKGLQVAGMAAVASALGVITTVFVDKVLPHAQRTLKEPDALQRIADAVRVEWSEELVHRFVATERDLVAVRWQPRTDLAGRLGDSDLLISGTMRDVSAIVDQFMQLQPRRRMVLLGRPGSGKSTLAVSMVIKILDHPAHRQLAVPVPLSLSSWNPNAVALRDWISRRIADDSFEYVKKDLDRGEWLRIVQRLVTQGRLLPVLDGLDELAEKVRVRALQDIEHTLGGQDLILACRSEEYSAVKEAGGVLTGVAVAEAQDIELDRAVGYLREMTSSATSEQWIKVYSGLLNSDSPGAAMLRTPLMLSLIHRAEQNVHAGMPAMLLDDTETVESLQGKLYRNLLSGVDRRYAARAGRHGASWDPQKVQRWLVNLAKHLDGSDLYDIAFWQLPQAITRPARMTVAMVACIVGLVAGITLGDLLLGLGIGIAVGLVAGFVGGRLVPGREVRAPVRVSSSKGAVLQPQGLFHTLAFGGFCGVVAGLVVHTLGVTPLKTALAAPLAICLALYLGWQPWQRWTEVKESSGYLTPHQILRIDRLRTLVIGAGVLAVGAALIALTGFFAAGLMLGLGLGMVASFVVHWFAMAWFSFCISRLFLAAGRTFPLRLVAFLDYMYACQVLRRVGGVYQFQHATFQDYLAHTHTPSVPSDSAAAAR